MKIVRSLCFAMLLVVALQFVSAVATDSESNNVNESMMHGRHLSRDNWDRVVRSYGAMVDRAVAVTSAASSNYNTISVANGYVYVTTAGVGRSGVSQFNAADITSAAEIHYTSPDASGTSTAGPTATDRFVYFSSSNWEYQVNASNVAQLIAKNRIGAPTFGAVISSIPAVYGGYVFVGTAETDTRASPTASMVKLPANNITTTYERYSMGNVPANAINSNPAIANDGTYWNVYFGGQNLRAYRMQAIPSLVLGGGGTYVGTGRYWLSGPVVHNGYVYHGALDGYLYQFPATSLSSYTNRVKLGPTNGQPRTPAIDTDTGNIYATNYTYFAASGNYYLVKLSANLTVLATALITSTYSTGSGTPVFEKGPVSLFGSTYSQGVVYVSTSGSLKVFTADTLTFIGQWTVSGQAEIAVNDKYVYAVTSGNLYQFVKTVPTYDVNVWSLEVIGAGLLNAHMRTLVDNADDPCVSNPAVAKCEGGVNGVIVAYGDDVGDQHVACLDTNMNIEAFGQISGVPSACIHSIASLDVEGDGVSEVLTPVGVLVVDGAEELPETHGFSAFSDASANVEVVDTTSDMLLDMLVMNATRLTMLLSNNGLLFRMGMSCSFDQDQKTLTVKYTKNQYLEGSLRSFAVVSGLYINNSGVLSKLSDDRTVNFAYNESYIQSTYKVDLPGKYVLNARGALNDGGTYKYYDKMCSFESVVPVVTVTKGCEMGVGGEFNFFDSVRNYGWTVSGVNEPALTGGYAVFNRGQILMSHPVTCSVAKVNVTIKFMLNDAGPHDFTLSVKGLDREKKETVAGAIRVQEQERNEKNLWVYSNDKAYSMGVLSWSTKTNSSYESTVNLLLNGEAVTLTGYGSKRYIGIHYIELINTSGNYVNGSVMLGIDGAPLSVNFGQTITVTLGGSDYEITPMTGNDVLVNKVVGGEFSELTMVFDMNSQTYSVFLDNVSLGTLDFQNRAPLGISGVTVDDKFGTYTVDYIRVIQASIDRIVTKPEVVTQTEIAREPLMNCLVGNSTDVAGASYVNVKEYCDNLYMNGLSDNVYCSLTELRAAVKYNTDCYKEAVDYCYDVTYQETAGFDPTELGYSKASCRSEDRSQCRLDGIAACNTALGVSVAVDKMALPFWGAVWMFIRNNVLFAIILIGVLLVLIASTARRRK